jgi:hypothetical protein
MEVYYAMSDRIHATDACQAWKSQEINVHVPQSTAPHRAFQGRLQRGDRSRAFSY